MKRLTLLHTAAILLFVSSLYSQEKKKFEIKFGKISKSEFTLPEDAENKDAAAFVIYDKGTTEFKGNNKSWFSLRFKRQVRIKINNANGVDAADFTIYLYNDDGAVEKITSLNAKAYNLEGEKVVETSLSKDQVFNNKYSRNLDARKFTVPGAKAGALIEVSYEIESDFLSNLQPWTFQGKYPCYWSEYEVDLPEFFDYTILSQGYQQPYIAESKERQSSFRVMVPASGEILSRSEVVPLDATVRENYWAMKNVPALKEEPFTTTLDNHVSKVEFQLTAYRYPLQEKDVMAKWPQVVNALNQFEDFGEALYKNNNWLDDELKPVTANAKNDIEKAQKVFSYVRDHYTCTSSSGLYLTSNLKAVQKIKSGNVADINLMLTAMLNHEKIEAEPVILSTRSHGITHQYFPLMDRFNYVVVRAKIDTSELYLDATEPGLPFGNLPPQCYNGHARVIAGAGWPVYFMPDSVTEKKVTTLFMVNDEKGEWKGNITSKLGTFESLALRQEAKKEGEPEIRNRIRKALPTEFSAEVPEFENLDNTEENVVVKYEVKPIVEKDVDIIYLNPMIGEAYKENPFKSAVRRYPVEMPYAMNETYVANIEIPEGYNIEEVPKSTRVGLFEGDGMFEYRISKEDNRVMLISKLVINKADFSSDDYEALRNFFSFVVSKEAESIVLKKKVGTK